MKAKTTSYEDSDTVTFSITGGVDSAAFELGDSTPVATPGDDDGLQLRFKSAPDYENSTDADDTNTTGTDESNDNIYLVTVTASDGASNSATLDMTITVNNLNETPVISTLAAQTVNEGETDVVALAATDDDVGDTVTFSITGGVDSAAFELGDSTPVATPGDDGLQLQFKSAPTTRTRPTLKT